MLDQTEIKKRKEAVYFTLKTFLNSEDLAKAIDIWEKEFSNTKSGSINQFLNRISSFSDINGSRAEILVALTKSQKSVNNHNPDATLETQRHISPNADHSMKIFEFLIDSLSLILSDKDSNIKNSLAQNVSKNLNTLDLNSNQKNQLLQFVAGNLDTISISISMEEQKKIIHLLYAYSCELVGPVNADKVMSQAINSAENLPEAKIISPKKWL